MKTFKRKTFYVAVLATIGAIGSTALPGHPQTETVVDFNFPTNADDIGAKYQDSR